MSNDFNTRSKTRQFGQILLYVCVMLLILSVTSTILTLIFGNNLVSYALFLAFAMFYSTNNVYERITGWIITQFGKINKIFERKACIVA